MKTAREIREEKQAVREAKREAREAKKLARQEKLRIQKLPAKKMTPSMIKAVISKIDPEGKFSDKKAKAMTARIKQLGELKPGVIANRLRARKAQVAMIEAIFETVTTK